MESIIRDIEKLQKIRKILCDRREKAGDKNLGSNIERLLNKRMADLLSVCHFYKE